MFVQERQAEIRKRLAERPRYEVEQLQRILKVSRSTLRRDLLELEDRGEVVRVHGGVVHPQYLRGESTFERRRTQQVNAKRCIAAAAAEKVPANATVYIDAGSTCLEVARRLLVREDVKLFTHSVALLAESQGAAASLTCIGGELRGVSGALVGAFALDWVARLRFQFAFLGASGLDASEGASTTELHEAAVKQAILARARRRVLVCDTSKAEQPASVAFAHWGAFNAWIADRAVDPTLRRAAKEAGVDVVVARST